MYVNTYLFEPFVWQHLLLTSRQKPPKSASLSSTNVYVVLPENQSTMFIVCLFAFVPLENFSFMRRRQHYRWKAAIFFFLPEIGAHGRWAVSKGSLTCHTYYDKGRPYIMVFLRTPIAISRGFPAELGNIPQRPRFRGQSEDSTFSEYHGKISSVLSDINKTYNVTINSRVVCFIFFNISDRTATRDYLEHN